MTFIAGEQHDPATLAATGQLVAELSGLQIAARVGDLVRANDRWRRRCCVNLIAAESPTSPMVRALLAAEVGTRASGGHIGLFLAASRACDISMRSRLSASNY